MIQSRLGGTFDLRYASSDPLFSHYAVENANWLAHDPAGDLKITGSGAYQVGGEFAVQERMVLDLSVNGQAAQHFDSGMITGGGDFPRITIRVRIHAAPACFDTVITIDASPAVLGVGPESEGLPRVRPNPFVARAEVSFGLHAAGRVDVTVHDLSGRTVRRLARASWFEAGIHSLAWDGRREDGADAPAGLYVVRIRADGRVVDRSVVKLR